ncbi:MAG: transposase [Akkermansia sp.]|nr:transposase [Akkermansia sp.]
MLSEMLWCSGISTNFFTNAWDSRPLPVASGRGIKASRITLLDSSVITLCLSMFNWAHYSEEKGAIKLHTLFSLNDFLPIDVHVSDGKMSDNIGAYHLMPPGRSIIVADRGYDDTELRRDWDSRGISFARAIAETDRKHQRSRFRKG